MKPDFSKQSPFAYAKREYEKRGVDFDAMLNWHHKNGWVVSIPWLFCCGYFYLDDGKIVCRVIYLAGEIAYLLSFCPNYYLDYIEFERNFTGHVKRYSFEKFLEKLNG